jgi:hypothetical protein
MGAHGDFSQFYSDDITWTMVDAGITISGAAHVGDYVTALHAQIADVRTRRVSVGDGAAYLEGECTNAQALDGPRIGYCVTYDLSGTGSRRCAATGHSARSPARFRPPLPDRHRYSELDEA